MLNKILSYYKKEIKLLILFLTSSLIVTLLDLYGPVLVQELIDKTIPDKNLTSFFKYSLILFSTYIIRYFISVYSSSKGQFMGNKIKFYMREDLFKKIMSQDIDFFKKNQGGEIISRVTSDLENVSSLLYRGLEDFLFSVISILGALFLMFNFNKELTLLTMAPLPFAVYLTFIQNKKMKISYLNIRKDFSKLADNIHNNIRLIFFIKDNVLEDKKIDVFNNKNENLLKTEKNSIKNISVLMSGINFYNQITHLIIIFAGGYLHIKGEISLGVIVSFLLLTNRFRIYLLRLLGLADTFQKGMTGIERFDEIMSLKPQETGNIFLHEEIRNIKINNLNFSYNSKNIFNNLSLDISKGDRVAFVGESGVGKTTIFSLLKKNLNEFQGEILINDININKINKKEYLKKIGSVDQNEHIMDGNLIENISIVKNNFSDYEFEQAIKLALIDELYNDTDNLKIKDTISSGQKQRISLARLFLKKPDVVLLDEGTSALDNILEAQIMKNIIEEFKDKIVISIAHRLDSLVDFNKIVVLGDNGILETGDFNTLLEKKGIFYKMYSRKY